MARVIVVDGRETVARALVERLRESRAVESCERAPQGASDSGGMPDGGRPSLLPREGFDTVVYSPPPSSRRQAAPDLSEAKAVFEECARAGANHLVLLSSAAIYGAAHHNIGLLRETHLVTRGSRPALPACWLELESLAASRFGEGTGARLAVLRAAAVPVPGGDDYFSRLLSGRLALTLPGHDPSLQFLDPEDLARAVCSVVEQRARGVYNVAPDGVVPLRAALRISGARRVPVSRLLQRAARAALAPAGLAHPIEQLEYVRYSWTISNEKIKRELGYAPRRSSAEAVRDFRAAISGVGAEVAGSKRRTHSRDGALPEFDDFGMDKGYVAAFGRTLFKLLHDGYWRVEVKGLEHVPREGRVVMVGVHRGFMPWDAVMTLHLLARELKRYPRFLIHPGLIKFPFLFNFHTKLGGVVACQENADRVLERDEILAIYPEGIRGAFSLYRDAYRLGKFGRDEFVKVALRRRAPLVPFVTVGSAETFPIIGRLNWNWWKRHTEWPFFPLTPTWPLAPVPLPSKWHTQFLAPIHVERDYPPEAAEDAGAVRAISREVRCRMEEAIGEMLRRRKSIFFGSVFEREAAEVERPGYEERLKLKEKTG